MISVFERQEQYRLPPGSFPSCPLGVAVPTRSSPSHSLTRLPPELWQLILADDCLTQRDVACLRGTDRATKSLVDQLHLPQFVLPTTAVIPSATPEVRTVRESLHARAEAHSRAVLGQYRRTEFEVGPHHLFLIDEPDVALIRCGNGRLLLADLYSPFSLFSEVARPGYFLPNEMLLAAARSAREEESWRIVAADRETDVHRVLMCRRDGSVVSSVLPPAPTSLSIPFADQYVFSGDGEYLIFRSRQTTRRYKLGENTISIECEVSFPPFLVTSLCPATGRRFEYATREQPMIRIYESDVSTTVLEQFSLPGIPGDVRAMTVSPDGTTLGLLARGFSRQERGSASKTRKISTYSLPFNESPSASLQSQYISNPEWAESATTEGEASWFQDVDETWDLVERSLVQTRKFDFGTAWRPGLVDDRDLVTLCAATDCATQLIFLTSLPDNADRRRSVYPSTAKKLHYRMSQQALGITNFIDILLSSLLADLSFTLVLGSLCETYEDHPRASIKFLAVSGCVLLATFCSVAYLRYGQRLRPTVWPIQVFDLQTLPLPRAT